MSDVNLNNAVNVARIFLQRFKNLIPRYFMIFLASAFSVSLT